MTTLGLDQYRQLGAHDIAEAVNGGSLRPDEVRAAAFELYQATNSDTNAIVEWYDKPDVAPQDQLGPERPLAGVPILAKDYGSAVEGRLVEMGSNLASGHRATKTSAYMWRLLRAGAQIVGRSAVPEFIQHGTTESARFGATRNPIDRRFSAGGSSGGAAAAVASGVVPAAHASDCAGSIRIPAAACGLVGLKPGLGRVPWIDTAAASDWSGIAAEFVVTRSIADARLFLDVLADSDQPLGYTPTKPSMRIALSLDHWAGYEPEPAVVAATTAAAERLRAAGHTVDLVQPPLDYQQLGSTWHGLFSTAVAAEVEALQRPASELGDSELGGSELGDSELGDSGLIEPITRQILAEVAALDVAARSAVQRRRQEITRRLEHEMNGFDAILTPTLGRSTIPLNTVAGQGSLAHYLERNDELFPYSYLFNVTGWPSLSVPAGVAASTTTTALPLGIQLSGPPGSEHYLLDLGSVAKH